MGKSPGKWIKTVLFRKKSSRSSASKKYANGKDTEAKNGGDSLVISHPLPVTTGQGANSESQNETSSALHFNGTTRQSVTEEEKSGRAVTCESECIYTKKEEAAAVTLQAAFRGYLARRAFHALWGIIRLQSLYRGHLVRRQAVVTLRCIRGIVKLQAIVRGRKVRQSDIGLEIHSKFSKVNIKDAKHVDYASINLRDQSESISSNGLVSKLLASPVAKPIHIMYANDEPNSVLSWLERWSSIQLWKPASLPKKPNDIKPKIRSGGYALETESGKMKRGRKTYSSDNGSMITTESEKSKRIPRKASFPTAEPVQEQPHSELEKVKRSLRKITSSYAQASDITEGESDKLKRTMRSVPSSQVDSSDLVLSSSEKATKDSVQLPEIPVYNLTVQVRDLEIESSVEANPNPSPFSKTEEISVMKSIDEYVVNDASMDTSILSESHTLIENGNHSPLNEQLIPLQEESAETQKMSKRRASLSAKSENVENGLPTTPTLPSYMAATESAKAKLRGQTSPRLSSDGIDKNGFVRRHSLPNSTNGKLVQRPGNNIMKMGRDQPIRVEWKR